MARPEKNLNENLILDLYKQGYTSREIAKQVGVSPTTVMNRIRKYGTVSVSFSVKRDFIQN
ncbi:hypothetical protein Dhaf_2714 [Desulfitobacterium hafniense DCB-2]|uniref:TyrR-like helix-turn-helix domain-containing protein n=1 Tax=Desulfitobacterium hafniense (strain DSM 10664 / DCB-2) TaxID=272564 RepID=B8FWC8_DESHD|nr:helix-turn-helix domain-containing protein [Desulfitobacterium hafniense]ACL20740.1 hypothetical protein Dhaf_2714 [Desulfitobacterium hafniense DCB-2]